MSEPLERDENWESAVKAIELVLNEKSLALGIVGLGLTSLSPEITKLTHLEILDLSGNEFSEIPDEVFCLEGLLELHLEDNRISGVTPKIDRLSKLKILNLRCNRLQDFPHTILVLGDMEELDLAGNQLSGIPRKIYMLKKLIVLNLHRNSLVDLSSGIAKLTALSYLFVGMNPLCENLVQQGVDPRNPSDVISYYRKKYYK